MKKYIIGLAVIGIVFSGALVFAQSQKQAPAQKAAPGEKPGPAGPGGPVARLKNFLQLTPDQEAKLKDFRKARMDEQKAFREQTQKLRGELGPLMRDPKADEKKVDGLIDQLAKLRADQMKKGLQSRREVQKIFTPEQLEKLKTLRGRLPGGRGMMMRPGMGPMGRGMGPMGQGFSRGVGPGFGPGRGPGFMGRNGFMGRRPLRRLWRWMQMRRGWSGQGIWQ